jgi:hypothetical protein
MIWICFYKTGVTLAAVITFSFTAQIKLKNNEENCTNCGINLNLFD